MLRHWVTYPSKDGFLGLFPLFPSVRKCEGLHIKSEPSLRELSFAIRCDSSSSRQKESLHV